MKNKVGNCSNLSSEIELNDVWGIMFGDEGCGIFIIIEMVIYMWLNCVFGSVVMLC